MAAAPDPVEVIDLDHEHIAERLEPEQPVHGHQQRVPVQDEADHRLGPGLAHGVLLAPHVFQRQRDGLLDHDVLARLRRRHDVERVQVVRRRDHDDVNIIAGEHGAGVAADRAVQAMPGLVRLRARQRRVDEGAHLGARIRLKRLDVFFAHPAATDDSHAELCHDISLATGATARAWRARAHGLPRRRPRNVPSPDPSAGGVPRGWPCR